LLLGAAVGVSRPITSPTKPLTEPKRPGSLDWVVPDVRTTTSISEI